MKSASPGPCLLEVPPRADGLAALLEELAAESESPIPPEAVATQIRRAIGQLAPTRPLICASFKGWRRALPVAFAEAFAALGFVRFDGVALERDLGARLEFVTPAGYRLRDLRAEDLEACACLVEEDEPLAVDGVRAAIAAGKRGCVALEGADIVALALAIRSGRVTHVYAHPAHRRRGVAGATLGRLLEALAADGATRATLVTYATNAPALALFRRLGFAVDHTFPQFFRPRTA